MDNKKNFDTSDLLEGLTGGTQTPAEKNNDSPTSAPLSTERVASRRGRKPMGAEEERISSIVNRELYSKCKAIASIENLPIKDVINKALEMVVSAYEEKHGPIKVKRTRKPGNINEVFD